MHGGQFLWIGFDGAAMDAELAARLKRLRPYGCILFNRNIESPKQLKRLCEDLLNLDPDTLLAIDLEGGPVDRLRKMRGAARPSAEALAAAGQEAARQAGAEIGAELRAFDIRVDFVPCVDLGPAVSGTGLEERLFGDTAAAVVPLAREFLAGLNGAGISGCLKHYPGLGGSQIDSHLGLPVLEDADRGAHLQPYHELRAAAPFVMVAHARYPALYEDPRPASLNPESYAALRDVLGFAGAALSDDLRMSALSEYGAAPGLAIQSIAAGADAALICNELEVCEAAAAALQKMLDTDRSFARRAETAASRLEQARQAVASVAQRPIN